MVNCRNCGGNLWQKYAIKSIPLLLSSNRELIPEILNQTKGFGWKSVAKFSLGIAIAYLRSSRMANKMKTLLEIDLIMKLVKTLSTLSLILTMTACQGNQVNSDLKGSIDRPGDDITVLQAWFGETVFLQLNNVVLGGKTFKVSSCSEKDRRAYTGSDGQTYYHVTTDCTSAAEDAMRLDGQSRSPLLNKSIHSYYDVPSQSSKQNITGRCEMTEFRTITPDAALASSDFRGIGFYYSGSNTDLIGKDRLHKVGSVTLKNGNSATVHRFIAQSMCFGNGGNGGSISDRQFKFRPFVQFNGSDGNIYNIWDNVGSDYLLGRNRAVSQYVFVRDFDRQDELLKK